MKKSNIDIQNIEDITAACDEWSLRLWNIPQYQEAGSALAEARDALLEQKALIEELETENKLLKKYDKHRLERLGRIRHLEDIAGHYLKQFEQSSDENEKLKKLNEQLKQKLKQFISKNQNNR